MIKAASIISSQVFHLHPHPSYCIPIMPTSISGPPMVGAGDLDRDEGQGEQKSPSLAGRIKLASHSSPA